MSSRKFQKYNKQRSNLKKKIMQKNLPIEERFKLQSKLKSLADFYSNPDSVNLVKPPIIIMKKASIVRTSNQIEMAIGFFESE